MGSATAMTDCEILQIERKAMMLALHREHTFSICLSLICWRGTFGTNRIWLISSSIPAKRGWLGYSSRLHISAGKACRNCHPQAESGNSRGDDRDDSFASQLLHEQVQKLSFVNCDESGLQAHSSLLMSFFTTSFRVRSEIASPGGIRVAARFASAF
jgi:hypothetical protein